MGSIRAAPRPKVVVTKALIKDAREGRTGEDFITDNREFAAFDVQMFSGTAYPSSRRAIAQAVKAAHPGVRRVSVDLQAIQFSDWERGLRFTYLTPRVVQVALLRMDQGEPVKPFAFSLGEPICTSKAAQTGGPS